MIQKEHTGWGSDTGSRKLMKESIWVSGADVLKMKNPTAMSI